MPHCGAGNVGSGGRFYRIQQGGNAPLHRRIAGRCKPRLLGEHDQISGMERGSKATEPHGRHFPVCITARPAKQIEMMARAFDKRGAQFAEKRGIIAGCRSQMGIDRIAKISHVSTNSGNGLSWL